MGTQAAAHGLVSGVSSYVQGGTFKNGFVTGASGSLVGSLTAGLGPGLQIGISAAFGGVASELSGGNFWKGAAQAGIITGFNHAAHQLQIRNLTKKFNQQLRTTRQFFSSSSEMLDNVYLDAGARVAAKMAFFYEMVKTGGPFDLKNGEYSLDIIGRNSTYRGELFQPQDFGNYNFGVAAKAYGLPLFISQAGAGAYQVWSGTSQWSWYGTYFDDVRDYNMIRRGFNLRWK